MKFVSILIGALAGSVLLTLLTVLFHWAFYRPMLADGQYALVLFLVVPIGFWLGAVTGLILFHILHGNALLAGQLALNTGKIVSVMMILLGAFVLCGTVSVTLLDRLSSIVCWGGTSLLWSGTLVVYGTKLLRGQ